MTKKLHGIGRTAMLIGLLLLPFAWTAPDSAAISLPPLEKILSEDGTTLFQGQSPGIFVVNRDPFYKPMHIPAPIDLRDLGQTATATFLITYSPAGEKNIFGDTCDAYPDSAKTALETSVAIWGNLVQSSVPITIKACWAALADSETLGYAGGGSKHRDFANAPKKNTWYTASLANSLAGSDLDPNNWDTHITMNSKFPWYLGTDGKPPEDQFDFITTMLHEICHGLNFSGTADYSNTTGEGELGDNGSFNVFDTFMKDGDGKLLIDYTTPSAPLGSVLTGGNLWFHGTHAMSANGDSRVKMYAPSKWSSGSSYAHLDYDTFKDTVNKLMVYQGGPGEAVHDPGPVTKGLLKDLGWGAGGTTSRSEIIGTWSNGMWYWNPATLAWTQTSSSKPEGTRPITAGDVTGDGKADIISCWNSGLWYQDGTTLGWTKVHANAPVKVAAGDITGDGKAEIVGTWSSGIWYWNPAASAWTLTSNKVPSGPIAMGDITGDGKSDIVSCWSSGIWYQNGATMTWTKVNNLPADKLGAGDITGDGKAEIVGTWSSGIWYWNPATLVWIKTSDSQPSGPIAVGDVTGDGKADIVACKDSGLEYQNGTTLEWTKVKDIAPDRVAVGNVTGD
jgi:hypothetical protein